MASHRHNGANAQRPQRKTKPKEPFVFLMRGLVVASIKLRATASLKTLLAFLEDRSRSNPRLPVIMIGYGGRSKTPGLSDLLPYCRRQMILAVHEGVRLGLLRVNGETCEVKRGRHRWFQRKGGRGTGTKVGQANEYLPGPAIGALPRSGPPVVPPTDYGQDDIAATRERIRLLEQLAEGARSRLVAAGHDP